jgi:hypothetical protein
MLCSIKQSIEAIVSRERQSDHERDGHQDSRGYLHELASAAAPRRPRIASIAQTLDQAVGMGAPSGWGVSKEAKEP